MKLSLLSCLLLLSCYQLAFLILSCNATIYQMKNLNKLIKSRKSGNPLHSKSWDRLDVAPDHYSPVYVGSQEGLMEADKIDALPGQPEGVNFNHYAGYVTVDPKAGRESFYYFVESPQNSSTNPLVIGNPYIDDNTALLAIFDNLWTHAFNSDETNAGIHKYCNLTNLGDNPSEECRRYVSQAGMELGEDIDIANIYAPVCTTSEDDSEPKSASTGSVAADFDPCSDNYVEAYLNLAEVQSALHARPTKWTACSGDTDGYFSVTSSRYALHILNLPIQTPWRPWHSSTEEVGGYVVGYEGLTFATVRGAGLMVPTYQPERALTLISSFLQGQLPPLPPPPSP
ncbi:hypothetical protein DVH24_012416 [Malus domestica]|uniref:Uncharacterized protein n=1 Tax=Malus domestica TaxID=3750 RepID=A0A498HRZ3_MALDO|nr:hypothetical protein DVH24_012416 [Malus domestica]